MSNIDKATLQVIFNSVYDVGGKVLWPLPLPDAAAALVPEWWVPMTQERLDTDKNLKEYCSRYYGDVIFLDYKSIKEL